MTPADIRRRRCIGAHLRGSTTGVYRCPGRHLHRGHVGLCHSALSRMLMRSPQRHWRCRLDLQHCARALLRPHRGPTRSKRHERAHNPGRSSWQSRLLRSMGLRVLHCLCGRSDSATSQCKNFLRVQQRVRAQYCPCLPAEALYSGGLPDRGLFAKLAPNAVPIWGVWIVVVIGICMGLLQFASYVAANGESVISTSVDLLTLLYQRSSPCALSHSTHPT